jgi:peptide/nickel transport system substrate-binding protein
MDRSSKRVHRRLNPFGVREIREAMNWLLDRDYIVQEIMGGLAIPKYFPITGWLPGLRHVH